MSAIMRFLGAKQRDFSYELREICKRTSHQRSCVRLAREEVLKELFTDEYEPDADETLLWTLRTTNHIPGGRY
jgi:hypothetical protein